MKSRNRSWSAFFNKNNKKKRTHRKSMKGGTRKDSKIRWEIQTPKATNYIHKDQIYIDPVHVVSQTAPFIHVSDYDQHVIQTYEQNEPSQDKRFLGPTWYSINPRFMTKQDVYNRFPKFFNRMGILYPHVLDTHPKFKNMPAKDLLRLVKLQSGYY